MSEDNSMNNPLINNPLMAALVLEGWVFIMRPDRMEEYLDRCEQGVYKPKIHTRIIHYWADIVIDDKGKVVKHRWATPY